MEAKASMPVKPPVVSQGERHQGLSLGEHTDQLIIDQDFSAPSVMQTPNDHRKGELLRGGKGGQPSAMA